MAKKKAKAKKAVKKAKPAKGTLSQLLAGTVGPFPKVGKKAYDITEQVQTKKTPKKKITGMLISVAETVGLTMAEINACEEAGVLKAMIEKMPLYRRAKSKVGMSDEMMAAYPNIESLKAACDAIHPQSNLDAFPKRGPAPIPVKYDDNMPDKFEIDSMIEAKFITRNRVQFDENNLKAELRRINRKYGAHKPVKIVKTTTFNQVKGMNADRVACKVLVTHYEIFMKG